MFKPAYSTSLWIAALFAVLLAVTPRTRADDAAADPITKLVKIDQTVGTGAQARDGAEVKVNYVGWIYDEKAADHHGAKVDSSYDRGQPITFVLGDASMIAGWNQGIVGMRTGGKRTLLIPARLAYGGRHVGPVPPHATLVFDIELLAVR
jgi:FKBP-type peptidyl-prolyl cis-trans isomerase FkpA